MKSKLELYEDILKALVDKPLALEAIAYHANMDCVNLPQRIKFLIQNDMVQERIYPEKTLYAITARGLAIYKTLSKTKSLEKLQAHVNMPKEETQTVTSYSAKKRKFENESY